MKSHHNTYVTACDAARICDVTVTSHFMALSAADVAAATLHSDKKKYVNLPTMGSSSEDEEDEHFVLPNQLRLRNKYDDRKYV